MDNLKIKGDWSTPEMKNQVKGDLSYNDEEGILLEVYEGFDDSKEYEIIWGVSENNKPVTLVDCFIASFYIGGSSVKKIIADYMFIGIHFSRKDDIKFNAISYNCSNLDNWLWNNNIKFKECKEKNKYIFEYLVPESKLINLDKKHNLLINTKYKLPPYFSIPYYKAYFEEKSYLKIECTENDMESLNELLKHKNCVDSFLTLVIGFAQKTNEMYGYFKETKVGIYIKHYNMSFVKEILPTSMFINYRRYMSKIDDIIKRWFDRYNILEDVLNLYFSLLIQKNIYEEQKFLFRVQILEAYHRKVHMEDESIKERKNYIKELIEKISDDKDKKFLKDKLSFAYEPSLAERLKSLFYECSIIEEILEPKNINIEENINEFVKKIRDTRNYLTHYDKSLSEKSLKNKELGKVSRKLDIIIRYYLFIELGFSKNECKEIFNEYYKFGRNLL